MALRDAPLRFPVFVRQRVGPRPRCLAAGRLGAPLAAALLLSALAPVAGALPVDAWRVDVWKGGCDRNYNWCIYSDGFDGHEYHGFSVASTFTGWVSVRTSWVTWGLEEYGIRTFRCDYVDGSAVSCAGTGSLVPLREFVTLRCDSSSHARDWFCGMLYTSPPTRIDREPLWWGPQAEEAFRERRIEPCMDQGVVPMAWCAAATTINDLA